MFWCIIQQILSGVVKSLTFLVVRVMEEEVVGSSKPVRSRIVRCRCVILLNVHKNLVVLSKKLK